MRRLLVILLLSAAALGGAAPALAHATSTSYLQVDLPSDGDTVRLRWDLALQDLMWNVFIDADFDGVVTWGEITQARADSIEPGIRAAISVARGGEDCAVGVRDLALAGRGGQNFLSVALTAACAKPGPLSIGGSLFLSGDASQRVLLSVTRGRELLAGVIGPESPSWTEPERVSAWASFVRFVGEGVWHVAIGYDHIAFVLLLLLPSVLRPVNGQWHGAERLSEVTRDIVTIITAFTVAHSTTLALAVTGTVHLPTQPIEVAIAASIAVAGGINLLPKLSRLRLPLAFGFGFVHGFGFANALSEIDAAGTALLPLLAGFNIGVEVAQLAIVALVLPAIYLARRTRWYAAGVMPYGSCALGAAGVVWLLQRL
ncbi:MAG TPA: HupE/UreJ family protein [Steroidobacteraceae bacterium]|nr:HupE/UreJ family protein [Steroidobacteraceae bacterium]